ncbi:flavin monoamine oxidase family protein [Cryobacterium tepidiphilum]|nr:FAD-dependent oxidoreductase [Cryobacterium tepidiphilum]
MSGLTVLAVSGCTPRRPVPSPSATATAVPPPPTPGDVPQPSAFRRTAWSTDPMSYGAASFQTVGSSPADREALRQPVDGRLFFAGEHTDGDDPGTVQGARASGVRAAAEVVAAASTDDRVAIVGAGVAGATAARELADAGYNVVVIEGRDRSGGRIHTDDAGDWPFPVELGAAWLAGSSAIALGRDLTLLGVDTADFNVRAQQRTPDGDIVPPTPVAPNAVTEALAWAAKQRTDVTVAQALQESGAGELSTEENAVGVSDAERLATFITTDVVAPTGANADQLSSWYAPDPTLTHEGDRLVTGGFQKLVQTALDGIDVLPSSVVSGIIASDRGISLRLSRGESLSADRVIITVPLGVLQTGAIEFDPPLPFSHRAAIGQLGMGLREKLVLRFDEPFWSTDATVWTVLDDPSYPLWFNLEPVTGEPILVAIVGGDRAKAQAEGSDDDALAAALASLAPFVDPAASAPQAQDGSAPSAPARAPGAAPG